MTCPALRVPPRSALFVLVLCASALVRPGVTAEPSGGAGPLPLSPPALAKARHQIVPRPVDDVFCDYRGRMWYTAYQSTYVAQGCVIEEVSLADSIKDQVERQWRDDKPIGLIGGDVVLFEPAGRVWIRSGSELLGYDGKNWQAGKVYRMEADCPGHGRLLASPTTWCVGKMSFFSSPTDECPLTCFDGQEWHPLHDPAVGPGRRKDYFWALAPLRDDSGLVAWNRQPNEAWVFRSGKWTPLAIPMALAEQSELPGVSKRPVLGVATNEKNELLLLTREGILSMPLGRVDQPPADEPHRPAAGKPNPVSQFGPFSVSGVTQLWQEHDRTILLLAQSASKDGKDLGAGLLAVRPNAQTVFVGDRRLLDSPGLFLALDGHRLMVQGGSYTPAGLIDLEAKVVEYERFDSADLPFVRCAGSDGRFYLARDYGWIPSYRGWLYALDRSVADPRPTLEAQSVDLQASLFAVGSDGGVWAPIEGKGLSRFDGRDWKVMAPLPKEPLVTSRPDASRTRVWQVNCLLPGTEGSMLAELYDKSAILFVNDKQVQAASVPLLVAGNPQLLAKHFSKDAPLLWEVGSGIAADKAGNIYWLGRDGLKVFQARDRKWKTVDIPEQQNDLMSPRAYGDGSRVLLAKRAGYWERATVYEVGSGSPPIALASLKLKFDSWFFPVVGDGRGGFYSLESRAAVTRGRATFGDVLVHLGRTSTDIAGETGLPVAFDGSGVLWTCRLGAGSLDQTCHEFRLIRDGKLMQEVTVPDGPAKFVRVVSPRPGVMMVWTPLGLRQYVLDKTSAQYTLTANYRVTCSGRPVAVGLPCLHAAATADFLVSYEGGQSIVADRPAGRLYMIALSKE